MTILWGMLATLLSGASGFPSEPVPIGITPGEHAACDGDAGRLCASSALDQAKLVACMKAKRDQLSPACSAAVEAGLKRRHMAP